MNKTVEFIGWQERDAIGMDPYPLYNIPIYRDEYFCKKCELPASETEPVFCQCPDIELEKRKTFGGMTTVGAFTVLKNGYKLPPTPCFFEGNK